MVCQEVVWCVMSSGTSIVSGLTNYRISVPQKYSFLGTSKIKVVGREDQLLGAHGDSIGSPSVFSSYDKVKNQYIL